MGWIYHNVVDWGGLNVSLVCGFSLPSCTSLRIACTCIFQMPIANIIPTNYPLTSLNRSLGKATVTMFHEEYLRLDIEELKIAVVHNGTDHYAGTKAFQKKMVF